MFPPVTVLLPVVSGRLKNRQVRNWVAVTSDDLARLGDITLRLGSHGYAVIRGSERRLLHRAVLGLADGDGRTVDHIDRNKLNCTRRNLRVGTQALNLQNLPRSEFCGTTRNHNRWTARAKQNGKTVHLGTFDTREEAAAVAREFRRQHYQFTTE